MLTKLVSFLQEARAEFKRVTWPSRDKTIQMTTAVLAITVGAAFLLTFLDYFFNLMIQVLLR